MAGVLDAVGMDGEPHLGETAAVPLPTNNEEAIFWLVAEVPELVPVLDHQEGEELLPYVELESDFLSWFVRAVRAGEQDATRRFVEAVEQLLGPGVNAVSDVTNMVQICVVHGLVFNGNDDVVAAARPWMGPHTHRYFDEAYIMRGAPLAPKRWRWWWRAR